jgi:hypothetical protein
MKFERGKWRVARNCCTSGMCIKCRGHKQRPIQIVQADGYSKRYAQWVASNWQSYKAAAEPMPPGRP